MYQLKKTPSSAKSCNFPPPFSDVEKTVALFGKIKGIFPFVQFLAFAKRQEDPTWDHDVIPVSYTHLDVYKRQEIMVTDPSSV